MSVNRSMKKYMLQKNNPVRSPSGAEKYIWTDVMEIDAAVYKKNDFKVITSEKYMESTHVGLTYYKDIQSDSFRLIRDNTVYEITDCNTEGRFANILLKVVT
ncbi:MAG: phage head-tail adapter protein [Faecalicatena sp.]|uniref:phage head-tail adapter protein n=1 Tax=Faecalicatena sp. TaxID=2005360 RepID=UPI0025885094|nr:phage head-tail adapter protein [Faecalicatena sp.]MCI6468128.1 phage head-tail adapter protein [Faecalicatena sp.]